MIFAEKFHWTPQDVLELTTGQVVEFLEEIAKEVPPPEATPLTREEIQAKVLREQFRRYGQ